MGRQGGRGRRRLWHPLAVTSLLTVGLIGAVAGVNTLSSHATADSGKAAGRPANVAVDSVTPSASAGTSAPATASAPATPSQSSGASPSVTASGPPSAGAAPGPSATENSAQASPSATGGLGTTAVAPADDESARVGALFSGSVTAGNHFCTASVIHSATRNLVLTAAHCLDSTDGITFVPGYRDGMAPYGSWQVTRIYTDDNWSQSSDPDADFAILQIAPNNGREIENVVGANSLGLNGSFFAKVRLYGYPDNTDEPILCTDDTSRQDTYQRRIDCPSYPSGTSGGPWIDAVTGKVVGVIGGYQQGGDTDDISYSSYFDHTIGELLAKAVATSG